MSKAVIIGSATTRLLAQKISELETKVQELESGVVVVKPTDQDDEPTVVTDEYKIVVGLNQTDANVLTMTLEECPFENWIISGLWESRSDTNRSATKTGDNTYQVEFNMANDATDQYVWYIVINPPDGDYTSYRIDAEVANINNDKITEVITANVYKVIEGYDTETRKVIIQQVNGESFSPKRIFNEDWTKEGTFTDIGNDQYELGYPEDGLFDGTIFTWNSVSSDGSVGEMYSTTPEYITAQALSTTGSYIFATPAQPVELANGE